MYWFILDGCGCIAMKKHVLVHIGWMWMYCDEEVCIGS